MTGTTTQTDTDDFDPHALAEQDFLDEVHSFQFWFDSIEGYLTDRPYGRLETTDEEPLDDDRRERLITTLCNYSVGETAALEGAAGLVQLAPDRNSKIFMATQVADEARHLEVFLHRLRELGVVDPESEIERRAQPALVDFKGRCSTWSPEATGRRRSSRRTSSWRRWSTPCSGSTLPMPTQSPATCWPA